MGSWMPDWLGFQPPIVNVFVISQTNGSGDHESYDECSHKPRTVSSERKKRYVRNLVKVRQCHSHHIPSCRATCPHHGLLHDTVHHTRIPVSPLHNKADSPAPGVKVHWAWINQGPSTATGAMYGKPIWMMSKVKVNETVANACKQSCPWRAVGLYAEYTVQMQILIATNRRNGARSAQPNRWYQSHRSSCEVNVSYVTSIRFDH